MDPSKMSAVIDWLLPYLVRQLQLILGFASYYNCFIADFLKIIALPNELL